MEKITLHSIDRASEEAVNLWSLASSQYPLKNQLIQEYANTTIIEVVSSFALNARRAMEVLPPKVKYPLSAARWKWIPSCKGEKVAVLWDALNRIIHARKLYVGFEHLPSDVSVIDGGAIIVPYIQAETDRKELAFIDPFSLSHAFLYCALPALNEIKKNQPQGSSH
ncbi:hypothetical protein [Kangiella sp.]|uniref:hypothetical protein n=1 Tax=Kangiella sp. TaxID=1920245 RepID=UPI00199CC66A|nr:hypothetical protein [Kangiella sp.]MBD3652341.1 hypothetical protein [Kangiella sp.]